MNLKERNELIHLLGEELYVTATRYDEADCKIAGCDINRLESKEAIQRRIKVLREELLELSKSL